MCAAQSWFISSEHPIIVTNNSRVVLFWECEKDAFTPTVRMSSWERMEMLQRSFFITEALVDRNKERNNSFLCSSCGFQPFWVTSAHNTTIAGFIIHLSFTNWIAYSALLCFTFLHVLRHVEIRVKAHQRRAVSVAYEISTNGCRLESVEMRSGSLAVAGLRRKRIIRNGASFITVINVFHSVRDAPSVWILISFGTLRMTALRRLFLLILIR